MAYQVGIPKKAAGDKADTGMAKTPAPHIEDAKHAGQLYGENEYAGKSYLDPGVKRTNDYLAPSNSVRDAVIARGLNTKGDVSSAVNFQIRDLSKDGVNSPDAYGSGSARARQPSSHSASASKVPLRIGEPVPRAETNKP
ncbi:MAG: hypothetical protein ABSA68_02580 [Xanthobacteraceae bacterium]|jgi:hypothetical protein